MNGAVATMVSKVKAAGLKLTPQRMAIISELAADRTHPTAQELYERLQPQLPTMSFATVYNTLASLADKGLCEARAFGRGPARFDPNMQTHDHAVCDGCGLVRDVKRNQAVDTETSGLAGFQVRAVEHVYRGLCGACTPA